MMGTVNLRCEGTLYGQVTDNRWLEVKCKRRRCGYAKGTVILHTIDLQTGNVVRTKKYSEPRKQKEQQHASDHTPTSVRAS